MSQALPLAALAALLVGASGCLFLVNEDPGAGGAGSTGSTAATQTNVGGGDVAASTTGAGGAPTCALPTVTDASTVTIAGVAADRVTRRVGPTGELAVAGPELAAYVATGGPGPGEAFLSDQGLAWFGDYVLAGRGNELVAVDLVGGGSLPGPDSFGEAVLDVATVPSTVEPVYVRTQGSLHAWDGEGGSTTPLISGLAPGRSLVAVGTEWLAYDTGTTVVVRAHDQSDVWEAAFSFEPLDFVVHEATRTVVAVDEMGAAAAFRDGDVTVFPEVDVVSLALEGDVVALGYRNGTPRLALCCLDAVLGGATTPDEVCATSPLDESPQRLAFFGPDALLVVHPPTTAADLSVLALSPP